MTIESRIPSPNPFTENVDSDERAREKRVTPRDDQESEREEGNSDGEMRIARLGYLLLGLVLQLDLSACFPTAWRVLLPSSALRDQPPVLSQNTLQQLFRTQVRRGMAKVAVHVQLPKQNSHVGQDRDESVNEVATFFNLVRPHARARSLAARSC